MKKIILTICIACAAGLACNAQIKVDNLKLGVTAGIHHSSISNFNSIVGDPALQRQQVNVGFNAGVNLLVPMSNAWFETGLATTRRGSALMYMPQPGASASYRFNMQTLTLPIYAGYQFEFDNINLMLGAGPVLDCALSGSLSGDAALAWGKTPLLNEHGRYKLTADDWKYLNRFNVALALKVGALIADHFEVCFTYERYFVNTIRKGTIFNPANFNSGANVVGIRFSYFFDVM